MAQIPTRNLTIGRGQVFLAPHPTLEPSVVATAYRDVGNCPGVSLSMQTESVENFSSRGGVLVNDWGYLIEVSRSGVLRIDDMSLDNLQMLLLGEVSDVSTPALFGVVERVVGMDGRKGRSYQIGLDAVARPTGYRNVSNVTVARATAPQVQIPSVSPGGVMNWEIDAARGFFTIGERSAIADSADLILTYSVAAHRRKIVRAGVSERAFSMQFHAHNPKGQRVDYFFPFVKIRPNGDLQLISEEYMEIELKIEVLSLGNLYPIYMNGLPEGNSTQMESGFVYSLPFTFG